MTRHTVVMERVGRTHNPAPFEVEGGSADEIAEAIYLKVRGMLGSREVEVVVGSVVERDLVRILVGGWRDGGQGRITPGISIEQEESTRA